MGKEDGSVEPQKIHTVVISTQHAEPLKAVRSKVPTSRDDVVVAVVVAVFVVGVFVVVVYFTTCCDSQTTT